MKKFQIQSPYKPSGDQPSAIKKIIEGLKNKSKDQVLLGVTGSGKTELYVKLAKKSIEENLQILVMVPEINLIPQTLERFKKYLKIILN